MDEKLEGAKYALSAEIITRAQNWGSEKSRQQMSKEVYRDSVSILAQYAVGQLHLDPTALVLKSFHFCHLFLDIFEFQSLGARVDTFTDKSYDITEVPAHETDEWIQKRKVSSKNVSFYF